TRCFESSRGAAGRGKRPRDDGVTISAQPPSKPLDPEPAIAVLPCGRGILQRRRMTSMHSDRAVKRNLLAVTLLAGVLMAVAIPGAYAQMGTTVAESKAVHFLRTDTLDFAKILPAPPEPGSLAAGADLNAVLQVQAWRTPEEVAWAKRIEKIRSLAEYTDVVGAW